MRITYSRQAAEVLLGLRNQQPFVNLIADEIRRKELTLIEALGEFGPFGAG